MFRSTVGRSQPVFCIGEMLRNDDEQCTSEIQAGEVPWATVFEVFTVGGLNDDQWQRRRSHDLIQNNNED